MYRSKPSGAGHVVDAFLSESEVAALGLKRVGKGAKISRLASFYRREDIELGNNVRIDDGCIITGRVAMGNSCHIAPHTIISGANGSRVNICDYFTCTYGVKIFSQSDDYSGEYMTGSVVEREKTGPDCEDIEIGKFSIIGSSAIIMPGARLKEGCAIGALSLVKRGSYGPWGIYAGIPVVYLKERVNLLLPKRDNE